MAETAVFNSSATNRLEFIPSNVVPFLIATTKGFGEGEKPVMASNKRLSLLTSKKATHIKVLNRLNGKYLDIPDLHKTAVVDAQTLSYDASVWATVAKGGDAALIAIGEDADGTLIYESKRVQFPEDIVKVALVSVAGTSHQESEKLSQKEIIGLGANGTIHIADVDSGKTKSLVSKTASFESAFLDVNPETRIIASPGNKGTVQLTFIDSGKPVLEKSWAPHSNDALTGLLVLPKVSVAHGTVIVTSAEANTDIRVWAVKEGVISLQQSLTIAGATAEEASADRLMSLDPTGEFVILPSTSNADPSVVMLEVDHTRARLRRGTDWSVPSAVISFNGIIRKRKQGASVVVETAAVIRTGEKVSMIVFDAEKLTGAPNIGVDAANGAKSAPSNVLKWFGNSAAPAPTKEKTAVVSSSLDKKDNATKSGGPNAAAVEKQALAALQKQNANVAGALNEIDQRVVALQQLATQSLKTLQASNQKESARSAGHDHGTRSSFRPAGAATNLPPQTTEAVRSFTDGVKVGIRESTAKCLEASLQKHLPGATQKSIDYLESAEKSNSAIPKLASTEGMQQFQAAVDKVHAAQTKLFKAESGAAARATMLSVSGAKDGVEDSVERFKKYMKKVHSEINGLKSDIHDLKSSGVSEGTAAANVASEEKIMSLLHAGNWKAAFTALTQAQDVDLLINVLESEVVEENHDTIISPESLPFPIFVAILKQLSFNMRSKMGAIPLRVMWIADFTVEWDEHLQAMLKKEGGTIRSARADFTDISDALDSVNVKGEVDSSTRRYIVAAKKVLRGLEA